MMLSTAGVSSSHMPEKYPIEVSLHRNDTLQFPFYWIVPTGVYFQAVGKYFHWIKSEKEIPRVIFASNPLEQSKLSNLQIESFARQQFY